MPHKQPSVPSPETNFFCSWSGGKDSCLALYRACEADARPASLLTMLNDDGLRSKSHGLTGEVLEAQAESMGIPITVHGTTWDNYESTFVRALNDLRKRDITDGVFGDIDFPPHLEWEEKVCDAAGMVPHLPIWGSAPLDLLAEFFQAGFKAMIVTVQASKMGKDFLGRMLNKDIVKEFQEIGIDPCGENGEYHTVVVDGPLFSRPLDLTKGETREHSGYFSLDVSL